MASSATLSQSQPADPRILGVQEGDTVSGIVEIRPNQDQLPGLRKVAYYLNGNKSGKVYQSPFLWGGISGTGTSGFDTRTISNGQYRLNMVYTDGTGDHTLSVNFTVDNSVSQPPPQDTSGATLISPSGRTAGGLQFPAGTSLVDVEQAGTLSFIADAKALYVVDSSNAAQPKVLSETDFSSGAPVVDVLPTPDGLGVFVLEQGPADPQNPNFHDGQLWRVDISNPSSPVRTLVASGSSTTGDPKGLRIYGNKIYVIHNEEYALLSCSLDGRNCDLPSELYSFRDQIQINANGIFSVQRGGTKLRTVSGSVNGDFADTTTPAAVAYMSGKDNLLFVALKNGMTAVYDSAQFNPQTGTVPIVKTIDPQGNDPVFSAADGNRYAVLDSTGLIEVYDISNIQNPAKIDSLTLSGTRSLTVKNGTIYAVSDSQYRIVSPASGSTTPPPATDTRILGVQEGQTVSGTVQIGPNQNQLPGIRKVSYYLNGSQSGKVYQSPFLWGGLSGNGTAGFDTRTLKNGSYKLDMVYTDAAGDHTVTVHFTVDN